LQVAQQADRVVTDTARSDLVHANVNMFIPKTILIEAGTEVRCSNPSNLPHNVAGVFNQTTGSHSAESTGKIPENSSASNGNKINTKLAEVIAIDSCFIGPSASWQ
jgi:plastocyanin